jgi:hypothetical protein
MSVASRKTQPARDSSPSISNAMTDYADEESTVAELRRIDFTGTIWFAAAIIAVGVPLSGLLGQGWRPSDLPGAAEAAWWVGAAFTLIGIAGFGWAGCPVLAWPVPIANRQKSICIRGGIALYLVGTVASSIAVLAVPVAGA